MAYDKVIDSTLLDAGLTATANAIRAKTGSSSPIAWDSANGFKAAVEGIDTEGGVELPELGDTAAQSSDIVYGKILYDDDGNPVTGTMTSFDSEYSPKPKSDGSGNVMIGLTSTENTYLPAWNQLSFKIPFSEFGNATEDDVLADIEFTSSAGLLARGSIPKKTTSDITVNDATVTIPRGYYESVASKSVSTTTQATPSISVDTAGKITASVTQTAGYVSSGTKTATRQLATQTAQTITPGTQNKTIASGVYLTGTQTIKGDANLVAANIKKGVSIFGVPGSLDVSSGGSSGGTTVTSDICEVHPITIASEQNNTTVSLLTGNSFLAEHYADEGLLVVLVSLDNLSGVYHRIGAIYHGNRPTMTYSGSTGYGAFTFVNKSTYVTTLSNGACTVPISNADTYQTTRLSVNSSGDLNCYIPSDKYLARGSYVVALVLASA